MDGLPLTFFLLPIYTLAEPGNPQNQTGKTNNSHQCTAYHAVGPLGIREDSGPSHVQNVTFPSQDPQAFIA